MALYFIVALILFYRNYRQRANWFLALVIGAFCEGIGLLLRIPLRNNPHSTGLYIVMYLFVVLSPCALLAGDYILLGRLVDHIDGERFLRPLKPRLVSRVFIISDVVTFLIQAAGGGLSISTTISTAEAGGHIFLAGLAAQLASFTLFSLAWLLCSYRMVREDRKRWDENVGNWKSLYFALGFSAICFLIRSIYRTIELSQGYIGYLATHERYFLGLDTLPLFIGVLSYLFFWPGVYIQPETRFERRNELTPNGGHDVDLETRHNSGEQTLVAAGQEK